MQVLLLLLLFTVGLHAEGKDYNKQMAEFRQQLEASIRGDNGPLVAVGARDLPERETVVQLESGTPFGTMRRTGNTATFTPEPGVSLQFNGQPVTAPVTFEFRPMSRNRFTAGSKGFTAVAVGGKYLMAFRDTENESRKQFKGLQWFAVDPAYRVQGKYVGYPEPKTVPVPDTTGGTRQMKALGRITFTLKGRSSTLEPLESGDSSGGEWFIMFRDATAGRTTYGAGRFLEASPAKSGVTVLDFNKAYSPLCAH